MKLDGIPRGPAGSQKIVLTYAIDVNGILKVTAQSLSSSKIAKELSVSASGIGVNDEEVERMRQIAEAESLAERERVADIELQQYRICIAPGQD